MNESLKDVYNNKEDIDTMGVRRKKNQDGAKKKLWGKIFFRGNFLLPEKSLYAISHKLLTGA